MFRVSFQSFSQQQQIYNEILALDKSPHSIHRAGEGSAIPVNYKSDIVVQIIEN